MTLTTSKRAASLWGAASAQIFDQATEFHHLTLSPDGRHVYLLASFACGQESGCLGLATLERDPVRGELTLRNTRFGLGSSAFEGLRAAIVSPDGHHLYLSAKRGGVPVMASFARNAVDGSLELLEVLADDVPSANLDDGHRHLTISPDGRHLYTPRPLDDALVVFQRDPHTGGLSRLEPLAGDDLGPGAVASPDDVTVSADSQLTFVTGFGRSAVATLSRRCLEDVSACTGGDRFRVDVAWRDFTDRIGVASHLPPVGDSSRIFWFFDENNWEMLVKVLDGCAINGRQWVFAAATTNVETALKVTDTWTGQHRTYHNSLGQAAPAVTDTAAFANCDVEPIGSGGLGSRPDTASARPKATCDGNPGLCVSERFDVEVRWRDATGQSGVGQLIPIDSENSGIFWFFDDNNWEMLVKVLDGCDVNNRVWVFAALTTDVETVLTVTDRVTGAQRIYEKPLGSVSPAITDTAAFASCGSPSAQ